MGWASMADMVDNLTTEVHIALVGKYTDLQIHAWCAKGAKAWGLCKRAETCR